MFASNTLLEHGLRGLVGLGTLWCAASIAATYPLGSLALGVVALLAFRGCPICWAIGLIETTSRRWRGQ
jgi:hypothetical protein